MIKFLRCIIIKYFVSASPFQNKNHNLFSVRHYLTHMCFPERFILVAKVRDGVWSLICGVKTQKQLIYVRKWKGEIFKITSWWPRNSQCNAWQMQINKMSYSEITFIAILASSDCTTALNMLDHKSCGSGLPKQII